MVLKSMSRTAWRNILDSLNLESHEVFIVPLQNILRGKGSAWISIVYIFFQETMQFIQNSGYTQYLQSLQRNGNTLATENQ